MCWAPPALPGPAWPGWLLHPCSSHEPLGEGVEHLLADHAEVQGEANGPGDLPGWPENFIANGIVT